MERKNRTPEENERRAKIRELLQLANIGSILFFRRIPESQKERCPSSRYFSTQQLLP